MLNIGRPVSGGVSYNKGRGGGAILLSLPAKLERLTRRAPLLFLLKVMS